MFLGVLNTVFLNISNYLLHLELRNRSIQIVVITNFVVIFNVGIKRFYCTKQGQNLEDITKQFSTNFNETFSVLKLM